MSDTELRQILRTIIRDIDDGRLKVGRRSPGRKLRRRLLPSLLAASLGLGSAGVACSGRPVGTAEDGSVPEDVPVFRDVNIAPEYGSFFDDAAVPDADTTDAEPSDAEVDSGDIPVYMAPAFD